MVSLLEDLTNQLFEDNYSDDPPKRIAEALTMINDPYVETFYIEHVFYDEDSEMHPPTCSVSNAGDGEHVIFHFHPDMINDTSSIKEVAFFLAHEMYHILRDHLSRAMGEIKNLQNEYPNVQPQFIWTCFNIAYDSFINEDIKNEGSIGGVPMKPPFKGYAFGVDSDDYASPESFVGSIIESSTGKKFNEKYNGPKFGEPLVAWMLQKLKENGVIPEMTDEEDGDDREIKPVKVGDIIKYGDNKYGKVTKVDDKNKKVTELEPLTREQAYDELDKMS